MPVLERAELVVEPRVSTANSHLGVSPIFAHNCQGAPVPVLIAYLGGQDTCCQASKPLRFWQTDGSHSLKNIDCRKDEIF